MDDMDDATFRRHQANEAEFQAQLATLPGRWKAEDEQIHARRQAELAAFTKGRDDFLSAAGAPYAAKVKALKDAAQAALDEAQRKADRESALEAAKLEEKAAEERLAAAKQAEIEAAAAVESQGA